MINSKVVFKSPQDCTWIEKFQVNKKSKQRDFFSFCDAIFIITVKKDSWTPNQIDMVKNINTLGCQERTYWCFTHGYKKCEPKDGEVVGSCGFNWKIICEFCIQENIQNILFLEDDLLITNKLWDNYFEKKNKILKVINNNKDKCLVFHFGQWPILSIPINKHISRGLNLNAHCILINKLAAKKYLNIYYKKAKKDKNLKNKKKIKMLMTDKFYMYNNVFKKYSCTPNNIFFQKSDINSFTNKKMVSMVYKLQYPFTGRLYYQYDPKFVKFWEPIRGFTVLSLLLLILVLIIFCVTIWFCKKKI